MVARTSSGSGLFSAVVGTCVNGDTFTIQAGHNVTLDVDLSGLSTGLGASTINGVMDVKADVATGLFMNGNLDINGALYIANRAVISGFTLTSGKNNVYEVSRTLKVATVEETLGNGYKDVVDDLTDLAVGIENSRLRGLDEPEMMADVVKEFRITYKNSLTVSDALNYLENNPSRFYHDQTNNKLYIHISDSLNPSTKTITVIEPIQRPTSGTESRCNLKFNATGVISNTGGGTPVIRMYGWYPQREWSQVSSDVALNATQIPLVHDMSFQAGDKIAIGCGTVFDSLDNIAEPTQKGVYTLLSYDSNTKTGILTGGLANARLTGDYICMASRPIKISRSTGTPALITSKINNIVAIGVYFGTYLIQSVTSPQGLTNLSNFPSNIIIEHCTSADKVLLTFVKDCIIKDTNRVGGGASELVWGINNTITRCVCISGFDLSLGKNSINESIIQNNTIIGGGILKNSTIKNIKQIVSTYRTQLINCSIYGEKTFEVGDVRVPYEFTANNCIFKDNETGYLMFNEAKLINCLFEGNNEIYNHLWEGREPYRIIESFDHNQTPGNYKAWMRGGRIITEDNKLKFICESNDYSVFRDYPILLQANKIQQYHIKAVKDFLGGTIKAQIIDPANDPLIDSTATPLAEEVMPNIKDTAQAIHLPYKSDTTKQLILRVSAQNASGNVIFGPIVTFEKFRRKELN